MSKIIYKNFNILIERQSGEQSYAVKTLGSGGGDARATFSLAELQLAENPLADLVRRAPVPIRDLVVDEDSRLLEDLAPPFEDAKRFGGCLFDMVFKPDIYIAFKSSLEQARMNKARLRIRLNLTQVPELAVLPWEYLHNAKLNHFYARFVESPVVRYLEQGDPIEALTVAAPLRVLVMIAGPKGAASLDVEREWQSLQEALKELTAQGLVELERLERATVDALQDRLMRRLENRPYHVFHFIGHGDFHRQKNEGRLLLEHDDGSPNPVSGQNLAELLHDHTTLRLAVINACEGARTSDSNSYSGTAQSFLFHARIPAVIAMQFKITDAAAIKFANRFYSALAASYPVDAALSQARMGMYQSGNEIEWATPVLYMRSEDGNIFTLNTVADTLPISEPSPRASLVPHHLDYHFQAVINALLTGQIVPFLGLDVNLYGRLPGQPWVPKQGLPSGDELAAYLANKYQYGSSANPDLAEVAQYITAKKRGRVGSLYQDISELFSNGFEPSPLHALIARMPEVLTERNALRAADPLLRRFIVVTLSVDNLLETEFKKRFPTYHVLAYVAEGSQRGKFQHYRIENGQIAHCVFIDNANDYRGFTDQQPVIIKLPGTLDTVTFDHKFAITEDHYSNYLTHKDLTSLLPAQLMSKLKRSGHLFLGYSLRSWNLRALLYRIWDAQMPSESSWFVHPNPQDADVQFSDVCGIEVIKADWQDYTAALQERIERIGRTA